MFNFYDSKGDGLIDFEEFAIGVSFTSSKSKTPEKLKRIFEGYDLNNDGYVERKDFLRMFKSFYSLSKVLVRDIVASLGDELYEQGHMDQALHGRQPISAIFTSSIPPAGRSFEKPASADDSDGESDLDSPVVLPSSKDHLDPEDAATISRWAEGPENGNGQDRDKFIEKSRRAEFWTLLSDDEDLMIPDDEKDVGSEVLFHMAMRGINELLDMLFKEKEMMAVDARLADSTQKKEPDIGLETGAQSEPGPEKVAEPNDKVSEKPSGEEEAKKDPESGKEDESEPSTPEKEENAKDKDKEHDIRIAAREEVKKRGGEGRLSYEEFEKIMTGPDSARLEFVGTWTDLASF
jgi:hypothetical protein